MLNNPASAPTSVILKELLGDQKASREQLMRALENRREILTRCMKNFSQKTLGQLACLDSGNGLCHDLSEDGPRVSSPHNTVSLDTRGFFAGGSLCKRKEWECLTFGFDCDSWLLIKTNYIKEKFRNTYEKALSVEVTRVDLPTILEKVGLEPSHIWMYLKMITDDWVSSRKSLYDQACKVAQGMNEEDCIFRMIS